jgi:hypothetical protein
MLSRAVGKLDSFGLVRRLRDPQDLRAVRVQATLDGIAVWQRVSAGQAEIISEYMACLPAGQDAALTSALPALENLSERLRTGRRSGRKPKTSRSTRRTESANESTSRQGLTDAVTRHQW